MIKIESLKRSLFLKKRGAGINSFMVKLSVDVCLSSRSYVEIRRVDMFSL
jgi:hypothetical protein